MQSAKVTESEWSLAAVAGALSCKNVCVYVCMCVCVSAMFTAVEEGVFTIAVSREGQLPLPPSLSVFPFSLDYHISLSLRSLLALSLLSFPLHVELFLVQHSLPPLPPSLSPFPTSDLHPLYFSSLSTEVRLTAKWSNPERKGVMRGIFFSLCHLFVPESWPIWCQKLARIRLNWNTKHAKFSPSSLCSRWITLQSRYWKTSKRFLKVLWVWSSSRVTPF